MSAIVTRSKSKEGPQESGSVQEQQKEEKSGDGNSDDTSVIAAIQETQQGPLSFEEHCDRWLIYFEDANVTDATKQRNQYLNYQDDKMYGVISTLCLPKKQVEPSSLVYQDKFNSRVQKENESASEFLADLQKIASKCKYTNAKEQIRSRLISGMRSEKLKEILLAEKEEKLTLEYVTQKLLAHERAEAATKALSMPSEAEQAAAALNRLRISPKQKLFPQKVKQQQEMQRQVTNTHTRVQQTNSTFQIQCYCCGKPGHKFHQCQVRQIAYCKNCQTKGSHFTRACKKKVSQANFVEVVQDAEDEDAEDDEAVQQEEAVVNYLLKVQYNAKGKQKALHLDIPWNGKKLRMEVDTGATFSLIGYSTWLQYKSSTMEHSSSGFIVKLAA
ncbi:uncharacterized protein LOC135934687 [Cloeon dipterum]|uniref:uncharacterized protein LOC135934687 n=1 Tax=Cloeon dipterum TaxID=197152 RepID=UPI00321FBC9E